MLTPDLIGECDGVATWKKPEGAIVVLFIDVYEEEEMEFHSDDEEGNDPYTHVTYEYQYVCYELRCWIRRSYFCEDCLDSGIACRCTDGIPNFTGTECPDFIRIGDSGLWLERCWDSYSRSDCLFEKDDVEWRYSDFEGHGARGGRSRLNRIVSSDVKRWDDARALQARKEAALESRRLKLRDAVGGREDVIKAMWKTRIIGDYLDEKINTKTTLDSILNYKDRLVSLCDVMCVEDIESALVSPQYAVKEHVRGTMAYMISAIETDYKNMKPLTKYRRIQKRGGVAGKCAGCFSTAAQACHFNRCGHCCEGVGCDRHSYKRRKLK